MICHRAIRAAGCLAVVLVLIGCGRAVVDVPAIHAEETAAKSDAVMFGDGPGRNLVNLKGKDVPDDFGIDLVKNKKVLNKQRRLLWSTKLGSLAYGGPTI